MACGTIQRCAANKVYHCINVACIQIVPHWGTNQGCSVNEVNTVNDFT